MAPRTRDAKYSVYVFRYADRVLGEQGLQQLGRQGMPRPVPRRSQGVGYRLQNQAASCRADADFARAPRGTREAGVEHDAPSLIAD